jgi:hypothetical protein
MKSSLKPGTQPSVSKELMDMLSGPEEDAIVKVSDDFDKIIESSNLKIQHFIFFRDLDLVVFILNNKRLIQRPLSAFPLLEEAEDYHLYQYQISEYGIHWPDLDADISLRGFLVEETIKLVA